MKLRRLRTIRQYGKAYKLYKKAFPVYERKPLMVLLTKQNGQSGNLYFLEEDNNFVGIAFTLENPKENLVMLDYFAIDERLRGKGYGSKAIRLLQKAFHSQRFFLEIEEVDSNQGNEEQKKKRKAFYLRNGLSPMDVHVKLFGVDMELLGHDCVIDFETYYGLYQMIYGDAFAGKNVKKQKQ